MFKGPDIAKSDGSLGAKAADESNIGGIVFGGVVTGGYPTLGTSVRLLDAKDADALGLTASYDSTNKVLVRYHIDEFYRRNPSGQLWIMVVAQGTSMTNMNNVANSYAKKLIDDSGKKIKAYGTVLNPTNAYTPTLTGGFDGDVLTAVPMAQALCDAYAGLNVYIDGVVVEGRQMNGTFAATNLRTLASPNVHVCVAQDADVAALDALYAKTAAVGTLLGDILVRRAEEDYGSAGSINDPVKGRTIMPVQDAGNGLFVKPALSSGALVSTLTANQVALLKTNAYLFVDSYPDSSDMFWSGSHSCTALTSDFAYGVNTRVWNRAARIATKKIIPKYNSKVATDEGTGYIAAITAKEWEKDINNSNDGLGSMVTEGTALKSEVYINPKQDIYGDSTFEVGMTVRPWAYARDIKGKLGFSK